MKRGRPLPAILMAVLASVQLVAAADPAPDPETRPGNPDLRDVLFGGPTLGWNADVGDVAELAGAMTPDTRGRVVVRLTAEWDEIERSPGTYDWSEFESAVEHLRESGAVVALCLTGSNRSYVSGGGVPSPLQPGSIDGWVEFARSAVRSFGTRIDVIEIWDRPSAPTGPHGSPQFDADSYAFLLKSAELGIRSEAEAVGAELLIAQGAIETDRLDWQNSLWGSDIAAYIDILPVRMAGSVPREDAAARIAAVQEEALRHPPAPGLWVQLDAGEALGSAAAALSTSASVVLLRPSGDPGTRRSQAGWLVGVLRSLAAGFDTAPPDRAVILDDAGRPVPGAAVVAQFFSDEVYESLMVYDTSMVDGDLENVNLVVPGTMVRNARTVDPVTGGVLRTVSRPFEGDDRARKMRVPVREYPMVIVFQSAVPVPAGIAVQPEEVEVERGRGLTAEEIIANHQEVRKIQDDNLQRWTARAALDYHFQLAQAGGTVDVRIESNYFWERGGEVEWEQTDYFLYGNRINWKKIPNLPLVQPEKVVRLPLDLTFDRTYRYRLVGEDRVDGREAYILAFEPTEAQTDSSLYRGRVWIDRERFVRLKLSVIQTNLESPVLSNEERNLFRPVNGPDGREYWVLSEIRGQQVWSAIGRNFLVERQLAFVSYEINPPKEEFDAAREKAYRSNNSMLRDTEEGVRYLEPDKDGTRSVKWDIDTSQLFVVAGAFGDSSSGGVVPLAGVNYFNYDVFGRNIQGNILFAGVVMFGSLSYPDIGSRKIDLTGDLFATALKFEDKVFVAGEEVVAGRIERRPQSFNLRLGIPIGPFFKLNLIGELGRVDYYDSKDGREAREQLDEPLGFILPADHWDTGAGFQAVYNRMGYNVVANGTWSRRSDWQPWGLVDPATGEFIGQEFDPSQRTYARWSIDLYKEWFFPKFQSFRAEFNYLDGVNLDRFSRFQFSLFGQDRLSGFSGTGVRFDEGLIGRARYSFNMFEVVRLDARVERARVKSDVLSPDPENFTGVGVSANLVGPWRTVINLDYGYAVQSDIPELVGSQEILLFIFKLF